MQKILQKKYNITEYKTTLKTEKEKNNKKYLTYTYNNKTIENITRIYDKEKYSIAYKPNNHIIKLLQKNINRDNKFNIYKMKGIYKITCNECEHIYIGKTTRDFITRFEEHTRAYKQGKINISNVADHLLKHKHTITNIEKNMSILEINNNKQKLDQLEKYYIYKHKNKYKLMNTQTEYKQDDLYRIIV